LISTLASFLGPLFVVALNGRLFPVLTRQTKAPPTGSQTGPRGSGRCRKIVHVPIELTRPNVPRSAQKAPPAMRGKRGEVSLVGPKATTRTKNLWQGSRNSAKKPRRAETRRGAKLLRTPATEKRIAAGDRSDAGGKERPANLAQSECKKEKLPGIKFPSPESHHREPTRPRTEGDLNARRRSA
jgi:hypothetical protein